MDFPLIYSLGEWSILCNALSLDLFLLEVRKFWHLLQIHALNIWCYMSMGTHILENFPLRCMMRIFVNGSIALLCVATCSVEHVTNMFFLFGY